MSNDISEKIRIFEYNTHCLNYVFNEREDYDIFKKNITRYSEEFDYIKLNNFKIEDVKIFSKEESIEIINIANKKTEYIVDHNIIFKIKENKFKRDVFFNLYIYILSIINSISENEKLIILVEGISIMKNETSENKYLIQKLIRNHRRYQFSLIMINEVFSEMNYCNYLK